MRQLGALTETSIARAIESLTRYDLMLAKAVVADDEQINLAEVGVEEKCLEILECERPEGRRLRFVVAALKINNDLERVGDLAVNIAKAVTQMADSERFHRVSGCEKMASDALEMLRNSLHAWADRNVEQARAVIASDDVVDEHQRSIQIRIQDSIERQPENIRSLMLLDFVIRQLERVGDMATNIAEDVIYMVEGVIVRHDSLRRPGKRTKIRR
jgi:phosphate transport system protein